MASIIESRPRNGNSERLVNAAAQSWMSRITRRFKKEGTPCSSACGSAPRISDERLSASLDDTPLELDQLVRFATDSTRQETVLYLGYGSNMCAETFQGKRNIKPLSQVNVRVPQLALTFDLPGIPYFEPCFGNTRYRHTGKENFDENTKHQYHKDEWNKGLVGVVYEVTKEDFVRIIATEGGGTSYKDILVDCYPLSGDPSEELPAEPSGTTFKAHTLFSPSKIARPDSSYAQPSPRYLKLITDGAKEHKLPYEYQEYLNKIGSYRITSVQQRLGAFIFITIWGPIFAFIFGGARIFLDKKGRYPKWYANLAMAVFKGCWSSYDGFFKSIFGDGERTVDAREERASLVEKEGLIRYQKRDYGAAHS